MKKSYIYFCSALLILSTFWISVDSACAVEYSNAMNSDVETVFVTGQMFGNLIGDMISLDIIVTHKIDGVSISKGRLPAEGFWGDFEIVDLTIEEKKGKSVFSYKLQSFMSPNKYFRLSTGSIEIFYTADKYYSAEDQKYVYNTLTTIPFDIYQSSLDPGNVIPISFEPDFLSRHFFLGSGFILFGLVLLCVAWSQKLKRIYIHIFKRTEDERIFLNRIIRDDLSLYDHKAIAKRLNSIEKDNLLVQILYNGYEPKNDEIKHIAQKMLNRLKEKL